MTTAFSTTTPAIGDLDGDGVPEVVTTNRYLNTLTILSGASGESIVGPKDIGFAPAKTIAIANLDSDGCAEIFVREFKGRRIASYDCQLNELWQSEASTTGNKVNLISLTDFDGNGQVELLHGTEVRNAHTGEVIINGNANFRNEVYYGTIALDILPDNVCEDCQGQEIIDGGKIYAIDITSGTKSLERDLNDILPEDEQYKIKFKQWNKSSVSIADYNLDGHIDVLFSAGQYNNGDFLTTIFFWDVANNAYLNYHVPSNHEKGTGRLNITDLDGDGKLNCSFVSDEKLYALDENLQPLQSWGSGGYKDVKEGSSGFTGCTVFDFNGDQAAEIIYRGEEYVHIIDGTTGQSLRKIKCISRTFEEYPIIADVDGDGATEICLSCSADDELSFQPYSNGQFGQIRVYEADGNEHWQPSRAVWNQHAYFNVNINNDLSVPRKHQHMATVFSSNICTAGPNRPLNAFLNQAPILDGNGCPNPISSDIEILEVTDIDNTICQQGHLDLTMVIKNNGAAPASGILPITFYHGAPDESTSVRLNTIELELLGLEKNASMQVRTTVEGVANEFDLFISLNDEGHAPPVSTINRPFPECSSENNLISVRTPKSSFNLIAEVLSDNEKCDPSKPDNGDAKVYFFGTLSETKQTIWQEDFEDQTPGTTADLGATSWEIAQVPSLPGYAATYNTGFSSKFRWSNLKGETIWQTGSINISAYEETRISAALSSSTNFEGTGDHLKIYYRVDGGSEIPMEHGIHDGVIGAVTATASQIVGNILQIIVYANNNTAKESYYLDDLTIHGVNDIQKGEITAGYDFRWYQNSDLDHPVFVGNRYTGLATGEYQIRATSKTSNCVSEISTIDIVNTTSNLVIGIDKTQDLTNCSIPNGILDAYIIENNIQTVSGYDFRWYLGNDFTSVVSLGPRADHLEGRTYSVVVTKTTSGCESTLSEDVNTSLVPIDLQIESTKNIISCLDLMAGSASVTANGTTNGFQFYWYDGAFEKPVPDFEGANYSGISAGIYTVTARDQSTQCISDPLQVEILDLSKKPEITITTLSNSSCSTLPNGVATVEIIDGQIEDHTYKFFSGLNTLPQNRLQSISGTSGEVAEDLRPGQYLVMVTNNTTGCSTTMDFTIEEDISYPDLPPAPKDYIVITNTRTCNGTAVLGIDGLPTGSIDASDLNNVLDPVDISGFEAIQNGSFEAPNISAPPYNKTVSWTYLPESEANGWSTTNPTGNLEYWQSGFQGVAAYEGEQFGEINSDGTGAFYFDLSTRPGLRMIWQFAHRGREGTDVISFHIDKPDADNPTKIGQFSTGKWEWKLYQDYYTVPEGQTLSRFSFQAVKTASRNNTIGNFIDAVVFEASQYYFELYQGENSTGNPIAESVSGEFNHLEPGTYTLSVVNNITGCAAEDIILVVESAEQNPVIVREENSGDEFCISGNGSQRITATTHPAIGEPLNGYEFTLFEGPDQSGPIYSAPTVVMNGDHTFEQLEDGKYTVSVTNLDNQCTSVVNFDIGELSESPLLDAPLITHNEDCSNSSPTGRIIVSVFNDSKENYHWTWFDHTGTPISSKTNIDGSELEANGLRNVENGSYAVQVKSKVTGCIGQLSNITIEHQPRYPQNNLSQLSPNTNCVTGNGSLIADVGPANETDGYTFEWFLGADDSTTPLVAGDDLGNGSIVGFAGNNSNIITGLHAPAGMNTYTVRVSDNQLACPNIATITLTNQLTAPQITMASPSPVTTCLGSAMHPSGEISITNIIEPDFGDPANDYSYLWYFESSNTAAHQLNDGDNIGIKKGASAVNIAISGAQTSHISGLDTGFYTVEAINSETGCISAPFTIEIIEDLTPILILADVLKDDFSCNINTPTGEITADIFGGNSNYRLEWFAGTNTLGTPMQQTIENTNTIGELSAGIYSVLATNIQTNCQQTETVEVIRSIPLHSLQVSQTPQSNCAPNGEAIALPNPIIYSNGVPKGYASPSLPLDYTYQWYAEQTVVSGSELSEVTSILSNQVAGYYTVVANENTSGCISNPETIEIIDETNTNTPLADIKASGTNAGGIAGNIPGFCNANSGVIVADITDNPLGNELQLSWHSGSLDYANNPSLGTVLLDGSTTVNGAATNAYASLENYPSGLYTLVIEDAVTQCRYQQTFHLPFNGQQATTTLSIDHVDGCPDNGVARVGLGDQITITYAGLAGSFLDGETVTSSSGAIGTVSNDNGTSMQISTSSIIAFAVNDAITGTITAATATINTITDIGNTANTADDITLYDIYLFVGNGVPADYSPYHMMMSGSTVSVGNQVEFTGLPAGTYTAIAREKSDELGGGQCYSAPSTDEIFQNAYAPLIDSHTITENTICDPATFGGNGSITVTARKNAHDLTQPNDFEFKWYKVGSENPGDELQPTDSNFTTSTLTNQPPGDYIVYIDRLGLVGPSTNSCQVSATYTIQNNPEIHTLSVSDATIIDCNGTGSVTILDAQITENASDYTYTWYQDSYEAGSIIGGQTSATLSGQAAGTYFVEATHNSKGCATPAVEFSIEQRTTEPIVTATTNPNTFCNTDHLTGNGDLTINIDGGGDPSEYIIAWYRGADPATDMLADNLITPTANENSNQGSAVIAGISSETISGLSSGNYLVHVVDNTSPGLNCDTYATFVVGHAPETPTIDNANINPVSDCGGMNGMISIENSHITGGIAEYTFTWFSVLPTTEIVGENAADINNLVAGTYLIEGTHLITGCTTNRFPVVINDISENPTIDLVVNTIDTSCDPDNFEGNGSLDWTITNHNGGTYFYQWYTGTTVDFGTALTNTGSINGTSGVGVTTSTGSLSGIDGGTYTLRIRDSASPNNSCHTDATLTLPETIETYTVNALTNTPNVNCTNFNGAYEITDMYINDVSSGVSDFDFKFTKANGDPHGGTHTANAPLITDLSPGSYQVTFTHQGTQCPGNALDFIIEDQVAHPSVEIVQDQADGYCIGGNGQLTAIVDATTLGNFPSYQWTPSGETTATIADLDQESNTDYQVTVTDPITGCEVSDTYTLPFDPAPIVIDPNLGVTVSPTTMCSGAPNGSIVIHSIVPGVSADYTYTWYKGTYAIDAIISGETQAEIGGLDTGIYFMEVRHIINGCTSDVFEFTVEDAMVYPEIELIDFKMQANCDNSAPSGSLTVGISDGNGGHFSDTNYHFTWSGGSTSSNTSTLSALSDGQYQIEVENKLTGCVSTELYHLQSDDLTLLLDIDPLGNENCSDPNGAVVINVLNSINPTASLHYYLAPGSINQVDNLINREYLMNSNTLFNMNSGQYTIWAVDSDGLCTSEPLNFLIEDLTNTGDLQMTLMQDHANTKCNSTLADGQASASSIPEDPTRYTFYWHDGPSTSDPVYDSTLTVYNLNDKTYAVRMVDRYTECAIEDAITISFEGIRNALPNVTKIQDRLDCLTPDGAGNAFLDAESNQFIYEWTDAVGNILSDAPEITDLQAGTYLVTITDLSSGCQSDQGVLEILDARSNPDYSIEVTASQCTELAEDEKFQYVGDGTAYLDVHSSSILSKIYYAFDQGTALDTLDSETKFTTNEILSELRPGNYRILAVDENNCVQEETFRIKTDVTIFNGVSDNGDGLNDYFRITCADQFPNNELRIYTRAGTLVYYTKGYEDQPLGNVFTGRPNTGLRITSHALPSGTYFYIFDKGEGHRDDLYQGYLEVVR